MKTNLNPIKAPKSILFTSFLALLCAGATAPALTMETVTIGNPGNPSTSGGFGGVATTYAIGKYEVTLNQYTEFLNAVADTDAYGLYAPSMGSSLLISRSGSDGSYNYTIIGDGQRPVIYVSWFDAARFSNWLTNGQPNTGSQTAGTTEEGAYTLNGATSGVGFSRGGGAQYWLPSENEWYKAAHYQPAEAGGDVDGYWRYPMQTNSVPYSDQPAGATPDNTRVGNFQKDDGLANGYDDGYAVSGTLSFPSAGTALTPVGAYTASDSYYGTFDQGGNVWELTDGVQGLDRLSWGGSWFDSEGAMRNSRISRDPSYGDGTMGFRVATVPEPASTVLLLGSGTLLALRRRRSATV